MGSYNQCDKSAISNESIEYLKQFINDKTLVMGVEIGVDLRSIFTSLNINFINFWIGSYKLFDDLILMINTNNKDIFDKIQAYKVHEEQLYLLANYWKIRINESKVFNDSRLKENSVLFAGQTLKDQAIEKDGVYLNILNFKERLKELSQTYEKVYYAPHPSAEYSAEIEKYIANSKFIEKLSDIPTYYLLASSKITKVIGISSSVLYEAQFFKKDIEYLHKPLFDIDCNFGLHTFTNVYNDYFNPYFWSDILSPIVETDKNVPNKILLSGTNLVRDIRQLYHGYSHLDPPTSKLESFKRRYPQFLIHLLCLFVPKKKNRINLRARHMKK